MGPFQDLALLLFTVSMVSLDSTLRVSVLHIEDFHVVHKYSIGKMCNQAQKTAPNCAVPSACHRLWQRRQPGARTQMHLLQILQLSQPCRQRSECGWQARRSPTCSLKHHNSSGTSSSVSCSDRSSLTTLTFASSSSLPSTAGAWTLGTARPCSRTGAKNLHPTTLPALSHAARFEAP